MLCDTSTRPGPEVESGATSMTGRTSPTRHRTIAIASLGNVA